MPALSKAEVDKIIENNRTDQFHLLADTPGFVLDPMPLKKVSLHILCVLFAIRHSSSTPLSGLL